MCQLKRALIPRYMCINIASVTLMSASLMLRQWILMPFFILNLLRPGNVVVVTGWPHTGIDMCEPISISMCSDMPYNMTRMPNHFHHSTQENARLAFKPYAEVLEANCSADLLFYLCAMFVPICTPRFQQEAIPPCRSVCERSRIGCEPLMNKYNYSWPEDLNCDKLPEYDRGVCVSPEAIVSNMADNDSMDNTSIAQPALKKDCQCSVRSKPRKKKFKSGDYDYAIAGHVKHMTIIAENTSIMRVTVKKVLKRGSVPLHEGRDVDLWTGSTCVCPTLKPNKDYLIISQENVLLNRLLYNETSLVTRWNKKWELKVQQWTRGNKQGKEKKKKRRRCRKGSCKSNSTRCRVDPVTNEKQCRRSKKRIKSVNKGTLANSSRHGSSERRRRRKKKTRGTNVTKTTK